jgi:hypothetical protein
MEEDVSREYGSVDWAVRYARDYRNENVAKDALKTLADEVLTLRAENRLARELLGKIFTDPEDGDA